MGKEDFLIFGERNKCQSEDLREAATEEDELRETAAEELNRLFLQEKIAGLNAEKSFLQKTLAEMAEEKIRFSILLDEANAIKRLATENLSECAKRNGDLLGKNLQLEAENRELQKKMGILEKVRRSLSLKLTHKRQKVRDLIDYQKKAEETAEKFAQAKDIVNSLCVESFPPCEQKTFLRLKALFSSPAEIDAQQATLLEKELKKKGLSSGEFTRISVSN